MPVTQRKPREYTDEEKAEHVAHMKRWKEDPVFRKEQRDLQKKKRADVKEFKAKLEEVQRVQVFRAMPMFGSKAFAEKTSKEWVEWAVEKYKPDSSAPEGCSNKERADHFNSAPFLKDE